jgi:hypothetical protein
MCLFRLFHERKRAGEPALGKTTNESYLPFYHALPFGKRGKSFSQVIEYNKEDNINRYDQGGELPIFLILHTVELKNYPFFGIFI